MDIKVINISQGPHQLNKEALKDFDPFALSFNVTSRLRYSAKSDYIGFQIDLAINHGNTQVFRSGFLIGFAISDWAKDLQNGLDLNNNRGKIPEICKFAWLVATGIVAIQSATDRFRGIVLPAINYDKLSKDVILVPNDSE